MRVLFATAEVSPVATVGGLAAAAAGLTAELRRNGVDVDLVMPDYGDIALVDETSVDLAVPEWVGPCVVRRGQHPVAGPLTLVGVTGIARPHPYLQRDGSGWPDNSERFFRFSRAAAALVEHDRPDQLARRVCQLLQHADLRARLGQAARKKAEQFDLRITLSRLSELIEA